MPNKTFKLSKNIHRMADKRELSEFVVFKTVFYHCIIIIVLPVFCFFITKIFIFDGIFGLNNIPSNVYSAIFAIVVLHIALGAFIYRAYFDNPAKSQSKTD